MPGDNVIDATAALATTRQDSLITRRGAAAFLRDASIETTPVSSAALKEIRKCLGAGARVYIATPPRRRLADTIDTARRLASLGLNPVPHIAARAIADRDRLEDLLHHLVSEAGVTEALLIGGSRARPIGDFESTIRLLETGLFERFRIRRIGVAGYPEGHPNLPNDALIEALHRKVSYARAAGLELAVVSQFCFDAAKVAAWARALNIEFGPVPLCIGMPGPASLARLIRYARICGVGESVRMLTRGASSLYRLPRWSPQAFLSALAAEMAGAPAFDRASLHVYSFGGVAETARWLQAMGHADAPPSGGIALSAGA